MPDTDAGDPGRGHPHYCDICGTGFQSFEALATHDCEEPADVATDGGEDLTWGQPDQARKWHVFDGLESLCGSWGFYRATGDVVDPDADDYDPDRDCTECAQKAGLDVPTTDGAGAHQCADCGADLYLQAPDAFGVLHYRCPGCGAGGYDTGARTGGPAFKPGRHRVVADGGWTPEREAEFEATQQRADAAERQADALERIADELEYQSAVLCELARQVERLQRPLRKESKAPLQSFMALQTSIQDHRVTREDADRP